MIERWTLFPDELALLSNKTGHTRLRLEEQETNVLALHLLQACLVYVNTLMIQSVLVEAGWSSRMTPRDLSALTPLIFHHVNPYGTFVLDMDARIPLEAGAA